MVASRVGAPYVAPQEADEPPFEPTHDQAYEPLAVVTVLGVPAEQRPTLGIPVYEPPLDEPQAPPVDWAVCCWIVCDCPEAYDALQEAEEPPLAPVHDQEYEPLAALTTLCTPAEQRPVLGAPVYEPPLDEPQTPPLDRLVRDC